MEHTIESVEKKIKTIVSKALKVKDTELTSETRLIEDLGADSLDAISIAMDVDEEFGIQVDDSELGQFNSCNAIVSAVLRHLKMKYPPSEQALA
jgi:acyl carrier protein